MDTFDKITFGLYFVFVSLFFIVIIYFGFNFELPYIESFPVEAVVTDVSYHKVVPVGKIIFPARYIVHFCYDDVAGQMLVSRDEFVFYQNSIGCSIDCFLTVKTFSDGHIVKELTAIADN